MNSFPNDSIINYLNNCKVITRKNKIIIKFNYYCIAVDPGYWNDNIRPGILEVWWDRLLYEGFKKIKFDVYLNCWLGITFNKLGEFNNGKWNHIKTRWNSNDMSRSCHGIVFVIDKKEFVKYKLYYKSLLNLNN